MNIQNGKTHIGYKSNGSSMQNLTRNNSSTSFQTESYDLENENVFQEFDNLSAASKIVTWISYASVKIRQTVEMDNDIPITAMTAFKRGLLNFPDHPAFAYKEPGKSTWSMVSFLEYYNMVFGAAKSFIKCGLDSYKSVGILGFNSKEWMISYFGAIFAGGLSTGIYSTNGQDTCKYVINSGNCQIVVVENTNQLKKILSIVNESPCVKAIVQYSGELEVVADERVKLYTWKEFMLFGSDISDAEVEARWKVQAPNKCCTLIYTSGTTGDPKGVMLSHDNLIWTSKQCGKIANLRPRNEMIISYLPLSHVAAQILDMFLPLLFGMTVYFANPDALKGSLGETLKEVRPTLFLGVPRVWEKMQEKMILATKNQWFISRAIVSIAKYIGYWGNISVMNGGDLPYGWSLANMLVFAKVRQALGFDRCRYCLSAAAPMMKETLEFFLSFDVPVLEIFGMSESSGPQTLSVPWNYCLHSAGPAINGVSIKISNPDEDGCGEICMNSRSVFMGYLNQEDKTVETFDDEGWLKSGDIGRIDDRGFLFVTGRIKELIITAGGENVAPIPIEDRLKEELSCISNCMLVGDRRKFISMLITLKTHVDIKTMEPLDDLAPATKQWCLSRGVKNVSTLSDLRTPMNKNIAQGIQEAIDRCNKNAVSRAQMIQKWSVLPRDFSLYHGELGPTLKLKRNVVNQLYKSTIDAFYVTETNTD